MTETDSGGVEPIDEDPRARPWLKPNSLPLGMRPTVRSVTSVLRDEFKGYWGILGLSAGISAAAATVEVLLAYLLASLAGTMISGGEGTALPVGPEFTVRQLALLALGAVGVRGILDLARLRIETSATRRYEVRSRQQIIDGYLWAEWSMQVAQNPGKLVGAMFAYLGQARQAFTQITRISAQGISFVLMLAGSFAAGGWWVLVILLGSGVLALVFRPLVTAAHRAGGEVRDAVQEYMGVMQAAVRMSLETRTFGVERQVSRQIHRPIETLARANQRAQLASGRFDSLYNSAVYGVAVGGLAFLAIAGIDQPARYAAVILLLYRGLGYGRGVQSSYQNLVGFMPGILEYRRRRDELSAARIPSGGEPLLGRIERIELRDVGFVYPGRVRALEGVSLTIERGEAIGLVGPSGAGKSTLVQLLLRLQAPTEGKILVNDVDLGCIDMETWYGRAVVVPQEPKTYTDTIYNNVVCYRPGFPTEDVTLALRQAHLLDEVLALPDGLDTEIGEFGMRMSGGQRQRLAIARALVGRPDLLVLDEPTSALDALTEEALRETLDALKGELTLVVIAHRLSTLRTCDRVIVLDHGRIEAVGDRDAIEGESPFFAEALRLSRLV